MKRHTWENLAVTQDSTPYNAPKISQEFTAIPTEEYEAMQTELASLRAQVEELRDFRDFMANLYAQYLNRNQSLYANLSFNAWMRCKGVLDADIFKAAYENQQKEKGDK